MKKYKCLICHEEYSDKSNRDYCEQKDKQMIEAYMHENPWISREEAIAHFLMELL